MADRSNVLSIIKSSIYLFHLLLSFVPHVSADYCEFGFCESEEYCCGNNKCCTKTLDLWCFWAGILLVIFALVVAAGVRYTRNRHATYVLLATHPIDEPEVPQVTLK